MTGQEWKEVTTTEDMYFDICEQLSSHGLIFAGCTSYYGLIGNIVPGHAYSVTGFGGDIIQGKCLRVRNPWGSAYQEMRGGLVEYSGSEANVLNTNLDGEFVIKWEEFVQYFEKLTIKA